jgi:hypothetical protein
MRPRHHRPEPFAATPWKYQPVVQPNTPSTAQNCGVHKNFLRRCVMVRSLSSVTSSIRGGCAALRRRLSDSCSLYAANVFLMLRKMDGNRRLSNSAATTPKTSQWIKLNSPIAALCKLGVRHARPQAPAEPGWQLASPLIYANSQASAIRTSRPLASWQSIFKNSGERPSLLTTWSSTLCSCSSWTSSRRFLLFR